MQKHIAVIGGGFSGLTSACYLAKQGHQVTLFEKNDSLGGRARKYEADGFTFDMGPSWYWMPDVMEDFFKLFGTSTTDYFTIEKLDPGFQIFFSKENVLPLPANIEAVYALFESKEKGSAQQLKKFLASAEKKYQIGMKEFIYRPSHSWLEYANKKVFKGALHLNLFSSIYNYLRQFFKHQDLLALMEFPVLFLGAMPKQIPALYSLMNYAAIVQGTYYPKGGMISLVNALEKLAISLDVKFKLNCPIEKIDVAEKKAIGIKTAKHYFKIDGLIASADYQYVEQHLLAESDRNYKAAYWNKKTFAPSAFIYYVGVNKKIQKLIHHNLFFDASLDEHAKEIYVTPQHPKDPLFYVCCTSKTDPTVAPEGMENLFILIPIAVDLEDTETIRKFYFDKIMARLEALCEEEIKKHVVHYRSYGIKNFKEDYHAFKGNAYGLANILKQTGVLKPAMRNKKVNNLFYAGQLTVPGPGVPPAFISGQIAAQELDKMINKKT